MTQGPTSEIKMLPEPGPARPVVPASTPAQQLSELPRDEIEHLAEDYGLDPTEYKTLQHLVAAVHDRRQLIAALDRDAMLDAVKWGRRPVPLNATREQLALEISRVKSMRFSGLSQRGLVVLARLRNVEIGGREDVPALIKKLKKQEGIFAKLNRKRRALVGSIVSNMLGEADGATAGDRYKFLPPQQKSPQSGDAHSATMKEEIEEQGLIGGITQRIKKSADSYLDQKLDEIEARIDRKLDEIDRRLAEWRDKEIANRIRILKITLWASIVVAGVSLIYSYFQQYIF